MTDLALPDDDSFPTKRRSILASSIALLLAVSWEVSVHEGVSIAGITIQAKSWHIQSFIVAWFSYACLRYWQGFHDLIAKISAPMTAELESHLRRYAEYFAWMQARENVKENQTFNSYGSFQENIDDLAITFDLEYSTIDSVEGRAAERHTHQFKGQVPRQHVVKWIRNYKFDILVRGSYWTEYHFPKYFALAVAIFGAGCLWLRLLTKSLGT